MTNSRVKLQHRPFLTPIWVTAGAAGAAFLFALFLIWVWGTAGSTTVIVIPVDPKIAAAAGEERTQMLARMFGGSDGPGRLDAIYASSTPGSRLTATPLAARLRIPLNVAAGTDAKALARRVLREHGGGRVLIVAHLDAFPGIVEALSGVAYDANLDAEDYRVIDVVTVPRIGHANLLRFNY
jgi:broad specificity phosphatase PhoE